jgi:hypothetical protein
VLRRCFSRLALCVDRQDTHQRQFYFHVLFDSHSKNIWPQSDVDAVLDFPKTGAYRPIGPWRGSRAGEQDVMIGGLPLSRSYAGVPFSPSSGAPARPNGALPKSLCVPRLAFGMPCQRHRDSALRCHAWRAAARLPDCRAKGFPNVEAAGVEDEARAAQKRHEVAAAGNPPPFVVLRSRLERGPSRWATPRTRKEIYLLQVGTEMYSKKIVERDPARICVISARNVKDTLSNARCTTFSLPGVQNPGRLLVFRNPR